MNDSYRIDPRIEWIEYWKYLQYYFKGQECPKAVEEAVRDIIDAILDGRIVVEEEVSK